MIIEFYVLGTMFFQNKWYEGTSFFGFKTLQPRRTGSSAKPYFSK